MRKRRAIYISRKRVKWNGTVCEINLAAYLLYCIIARDTQFISLRACILAYSNNRHYCRCNLWKLDCSERLDSPNRQKCRYIEASFLYLHRYIVQTEIQTYIIYIYERDFFRDNPVLIFHTWACSACPHTRALRICLYIFRLMSPGFSLLITSFLFDQNRA